VPVDRLLAEKYWTVEALTASSRTPETLQQPKKSDREASITGAGSRADFTRDLTQALKDNSTQRLRELVRENAREALNFRQGIPDDQTQYSPEAVQAFDEAFKVEGLTFLPHKQIMEHLRQALQTHGRNSSQVREILKKAKEQGIDLVIRMPLRGLDGPGSSLDLPEFQLKLTEEGTIVLSALPSTPTIASDFYVEVKFEYLENDPDSIVYVAPDYKITAENPYKITGDVQIHGTTIAKWAEKFLPKSWQKRIRQKIAAWPGWLKRIFGRDLNGHTPYGQKDAPAYIFSNLFGIRGVKITLGQMPAMALAGGMEVSNAFNVALMSAASMLSGADLSLADIFALAV